MSLQPQYSATGNNIEVLCCENMIVVSFFFASELIAIQF